MHCVQLRCLGTKAVEEITVTLAATAEGKAVTVEMTSVVDPAHQAGIVQEVFSRLSKSRMIYGLLGLQLTNDRRGF